LDAVKKTVEFAADLHADLIITHHPVIFTGIKQLKKGSALYLCAENNIAVISAHTNYDIAECGINANLSSLLGLNNVKPIDGTFISIGDLDYEMSIDDFAEFVKERLNVSGIRYTVTDKVIKTVAVGGGACEEFLPAAMECSDCFLTGDMKYHNFLEAAENDYAVISAGHFETESQAFHMIADKLQSAFKEVEFIWAGQENPVKSV
ncbi:MAG: Nif3-like dinuclear metal center hexameric protein, partial [Clostridiales bacterium]|nr:Nif3-like dinuclear metal center hexameric protein [Clostridiales bacterium]